MRDKSLRADQGRNGKSAVLPGYSGALSENETIARLVERLAAGDTRALARAISLVENDAPEAPALLSACFRQRRQGRALRIGITGAPGAGKSTLADRLAQHFRHANRTVGLLAVDPTSPFTGGALLGDRIRLREHASDPGFYCRSMATRGALGGLALATADAALVLEAAGKDVVLIETVGVGQDEVEIARLADITLVVLVPGMGDDVQSLKAGVMEIADLYVVNKADRPGAERVEQEIRAMQSLAPTARRDFESGHHISRAETAKKNPGPLAPSETPWTPAIVRTVATTGEGIESLGTAIAQLETWLAEGDRLMGRRARNWQRRLDAMLRAELMRRARRNGLSEEELAAHARRVAAGEEDPWALARELAKNV
jgi:LAO/AO transport system kinase